MIADGDHDWMDPEGGARSVEILRQAGNGQGRMYIVNNAGHHGAFNRFLFINDTYSSCLFV
jgi:cardiolipin-specific phospholipase